MSATDPAVIDEEQFILCLTGDQDIDHDLILLALNQCEEVLTLMGGAWHQANDADWCKAAHRARGFTGTMGFARAATLWNAAEFEATTPDARQESLTALRRAVDEVRAELRVRGYDIPDSPITS